MNDEDDCESPSFRTFKEYEQVKHLIDKLTSLDIKSEPDRETKLAEWHTLEQISTVLDDYQEQSYLLDPYLEEFVFPLMLSFKAGVQASAPTSRLSLIARLLYMFTKVRGSKAVTPLFPHAVADLGFLLTVLEGTIRNDNNRLSSIEGSQTNVPPAHAFAWEVRYILLLWLSLVCMLPFDLARLRFGSTPTPQRVRAIAIAFIGASGKERDAAVQVLARLYTRPDTRLEDLIELLHARLCEHAGPASLPSHSPDGKRSSSDEKHLTRPNFSTSPDAIISPAHGPIATDATALGLLQALCTALQLVERPDPAPLLDVLGKLQNRIEGEDERDALIVKMQSKLTGRLALLLLGGGTDDATTAPTHHGAQVSETIEDLLGHLMSLLSHSDTIVRYSAAKYTARISTRLPQDFVVQVMDALVEMVDDSTSEHTWHGVVLALAELARARCVPPSIVGDVIRCALRGLVFDRQRGTQVLGANVRDASAYLLWALSRSLPADAAVPHAGEMAAGLVGAALFDRTAAVRRAAAAAFQEAVGRWGIFAHGLALLPLVDFFTVSVRRRAFLDAAPGVARFGEYHTVLVQHLVKHSLGHYDGEVRALGAQALGAILASSPSTGENEAVASGDSNAEETFEKEAREDLLRAECIRNVTTTTETISLHGGILLLGVLGAVKRKGTTEDLVKRSSMRLPTEDSQDTVISEAAFSKLMDIPIHNIRASQSSTLLLTSLLNSLEATCTQKTATEYADKWQKLYEDTLLHLPGDQLATAAASFLQRLTALSHPSGFIDSLVSRLDRESPIIQQNLAYYLGRVEFDATEGALVEKSIIVLRQLISGTAKSIEAKRNGIISLAYILARVKGISDICIRQGIQCINEGFRDYTTDQRGDVGSWVREACLYAFDMLLEAQIIDQTEADNFISNALKQSVEKLDNIRFVSCQSLLKAGLQRTFIRAPEVFQELATHADPQWRSFQYTLKATLPLLGVPEYRTLFLEGIIIGVGSLTSQTTPFVDYATHLDEHAFTQLLADMCGIAKKNFSSNRFFISFLSVVCLMLENGLIDDTTDLKIRNSIISISTFSISKVKNKQRLTNTIIVASFFVALKLSPQVSIPALRKLLTHPLGDIREKTAEELYEKLSVYVDDIPEELECLLLETEWSAKVDDHIIASSQKIEESLLLL